jgi:hypothetical protein
MAPRIIQVVGWQLTDQDPCDFCGKPAAVVVEVETETYGYKSRDLLLACDDCCPPQTVPDRIAGVFARVLEQQDPD